MQGLDANGGGFAGTEDPQGVVSYLTLSILFLRVDASTSCWPTLFCIHVLLAGV